METSQEFFVIPGLTRNPVFVIRHYFVYILASKRNGTLYIGVTNNIAIRSLQHKLNILDGFTKKYKVHILVYYEIYVDIKEAIKREKQLKWWRREWKTKLIEEKNPKWEDLYRKIIA